MHCAKHLSQSQRDPGGQSRLHRMSQQVRQRLSGWPVKGQERSAVWQGAGLTAPRHTSQSGQLVQQLGFFFNGID